jgi:hypothetical protein
MGKDRIIFLSVILVGMLLVLVGSIISPDKMASIVGAYYARTELNETLREEYVHKIRVLEIDIIIIGIVISGAILKLSYLSGKFEKLIKYIKTYNNRTAKMVIILVCVYFLFSSLVTFAPEILSMQYNVLYKSGLTDEEKREMIEGEFYEFIMRCRRLIPEDAHVLLLDNIKHKHGVTSYYLYPRKLYFNPSNDTTIEGVNPDWISANNITWYINYDPINFDLSRAEIERI